MISCFPVLRTAIYRPGTFRIHYIFQSHTNDADKCRGGSQSTFDLSDRGNCNPAYTTCHGDVCSCCSSGIAVDIPKFQKINALGK